MVYCGINVSMYSTQGMTVTHSQSSMCPIFGANCVLRFDFDSQEPLPRLPYHDDQPIENSLWRAQIASFNEICSKYEQVSIH